MLPADWPDIFWTYHHFAAMYGQLGREAEAREAVANLLRVWPGFTVADSVAEMNKFSQPAALQKAYQDGLRKAGIPEGPTN